MNNSKVKTESLIWIICALFLLFLIGRMIIGIAFVFLGILIEYYDIDLERLPPLILISIQILNYFIIRPILDLFILFLAIAFISTKTYFKKENAKFIIFGFLFLFFLLEASALIGYIWGEIKFVIQKRHIIEVFDLPDIIKPNLPRIISETIFRSILFIILMIIYMPLFYFFGKKWLINFAEEDSPPLPFINFRGFLALLLVIGIIILSISFSIPESFPLTIDTEMLPKILPFPKEFFPLEDLK